MSEEQVPQEQNFVNDIADDSTPNVEISDMTKNNPLQTGESIAGMSYQEIDDKVKAYEKARKAETVPMPLSR
jgi:hypothetical protein